jgi:hypothetical protein
VTRRLLTVLLVASLGACGGSPTATSSKPDGAAAAPEVSNGGSPDIGGGASPGVGADAPSSPTDATTTNDVPSANDAAAPDVADAPAEPTPSETGASDANDATGGRDASDAGTWPSVTDYAAPGPFAVTRETNTGPGAAYDIFRPATLGTGGLHHPIVSWANGTLFSLDDYAKLLTHWASHGFVVIAGHTNTTAGGGTHKAAIDWIVAEATRAGSPYVGVLDTKHLGAAGHSQGGGATIAAGANKPGPVGLTTTLPLMPILSYETDKTIVGKQTAPMFNINATMDTRDPTGAIADAIFTGAATNELVQAAFIGIHEDAMGPAMLAPTLAWFRLRLMGDAAARATFYPPNTCGLCVDKAWKLVRFKNAP